MGSIKALVGNVTLVLATQTKPSLPSLGPKVCNVFLIYYINILIIVLV